MKILKESELDTEEVVLPLSVRLSKIELARIAKETKSGLSFLATLPPAPYSIIRPSMGLQKMSRKELCSYIADKLPRISAVPAFASCCPSISVVQDIYDVFLPLANMEIGNMNNMQKTNMRIYEKQIGDNFTAAIKSCASLSNGNLSLFVLTGIAQKGKSTRNNSKLAAPTFKLDTKRGPETVFCRVTALIKFATHYIVYYGEGEYDKATWNYKVGSSRILLEDLPKGVRLNFIMAAIGSIGEGFWSEPQTTTVPST